MVVRWLELGDTTLVPSNENVADILTDKPLRFKVLTRKSQSHLTTSRTRLRKSEALRFNYPLWEEMGLLSSALGDTGFK